MSKPKPRWANEGDPESVIELTDILDEGSSGAVFEGIFQKRKVAVKVVPGLEDEQMNHEISTEIEILRLLGTKNPFFVGFYGAWEKDDHAWLALELCEGGSIIDLCQICQTTLTEEESAAVAASVLLGLRFLHENLGYIHRDVKGKNILLTGDGSVKLTDLGIACPATVAINNEHFLAAGSPHWMAPELCMTNHTSFSNDVWSLGITLIELTEGEPPHSNISPMDVLNVIHDSPSPEFSKKQDLSEKIRSFLSECVIKDHTKRPTVSKLLKHPFVDSCIMHFMVSEKPEEKISLLLRRAKPILASFKEFERRKKIEEVTGEEEVNQKPSQQQQAPPPPPLVTTTTTATEIQQETPNTPTAKQIALLARLSDLEKLKKQKAHTKTSSISRFSEADGDLFVVDEPKLSIGGKTRFSEAEGDLIILPSKPFSEVDGDLVAIEDQDPDARKSAILDFIEEQPSSYEESIKVLNATRTRKRPESIRAIEKLVAERPKRNIENKREQSKTVKEMQAKVKTSNFAKLKKLFG